MLLFLHIIIQGKVQGVWFRSNIKEYAQKENIKGTVQNLKNKQEVEIFAQASEKKIKRFISWLKTNPGISQVEKIKILKKQKTEQIYYYGFRIL